MLKISDLIDRLQKIQESEGDLPILIRQEGYGGHSMSLLGDITKCELYPDMFDDVDDNDPDVKDLFPEWNGDAEVLWSGEIKAKKVIELIVSTTLYTT